MTDGTDNPDQGRRKMLAKLGLTAGAAYMAPSLLTLSSAQASPGSRSRYSRGSYRSRGSRHYYTRDRRSRRSRGSYAHGRRYRERLPWEVWIRLGSS
ncbi:hypothetical protein [Fodinicurvata sediminis]|uniref:hypothetical protein n=1 Tax=Fodinicurvata sediminis TaxID=1121832 RepID=UPI0003B34FE3|nr:hypothetical protein [Fodinicurvata sediminis]